MSVYSIVYIIIAGILLLYTLKNRLDLLCISAVCFVVYSIYCIPGIGKSGFYRPDLSPMLYYCIYAQMLIILAFSYIANRVSVHRRNAASSLPCEAIQSTGDDENHKKLIDYTFYAYTAVIVLFALVNIVSIGVSGFMAGKANVWEQSNVLYVISLYGTYPSFAYGIHNRKKWIWIPSLAVELTIFFAGSRAFAATMIIIAMCELGSRRWKDYKGNIRLYILGGIAIVFLLVYRMVDESIMSGDIAGAMATLSNAETWKTALEFNEPRVIIANYDYVLVKGFRLPLADTMYRIFDFIPGLNSALNIHLSYPEYFSDWLMAGVHGSAGVGGSIWGESYAMFGVFGIMLFTVLWLMFVKACSKHLDYHKDYSYFIVAVGTYLSWYINRLDFNRVGQSVKITFFCFLIWLAIYLVLGGKIKTLDGKLKIRNRTL